MKNTICIIQPGRTGDILITLPIAYHYWLNGKDIIWPVASEFMDMFSSVIFIGNTFIYNIGSICKHSGSFLRSLAIEHKSLDGEILDLAIGFGDPTLDAEWKASKLSFDVWKYCTSELEYQIKYYLPEIIVRDKTAEKNLMNLKGIKPGEKYIVVHDRGSRGRSFKFKNITDFKDCKIIRITKIDGYNIFNWLSILEGAYQIFCVDSSFLNLVDQFNIIPEGGRFFHPWVEYYNPVQLKLLTPKLKEDWVSIF